MSKRSIIVIYKGDTINLPLNENGNLNLCTLKSYYPDAQGLTYKTGGQRHAVEIHSDEMIIRNPNLEYEVYIIEKSKKIKHSKKSKVREIHVGWLHRESFTEKYKQMKTPLGGIKTIPSRHPWEYSMPDIKEQMIKIFDSSILPFDRLDVQVGTFDAKCLSSFKSSNNDDDDLWTYIRNEKIVVSRFRLYLLITPKENIDPEKTHESSKISEELSSYKSLISSKNDEFSTVSSITQSVLTTREKHTVKESSTHKNYECLEILEESNNFKSLTSSKNDKLSTASSLIIQPLSRAREKLTMSESPPKCSENNDLLLSSFIDFSESKIDDNTVANESRTPADMSNDDDDNVCITYERVVVSEYSNDLSIAYYSKEDLYNTEIENVGNLSMDEFDPVLNGFRISSISVNGKVLLDIYTDSDMTRMYTFSSTKTIHGGYHYILHDTQELHGKCNGVHGVGIITNCTDDCGTIFTWYENGKLLKQEKFGYWLSNIASDRKYHCVFSCKYNSLKKEACKLSYH
ncbi:Protein of unknown function [Cotesia congregata]|uniref:TAR DNA-binding protein 43 N-terminal domain-containing protein n=1 Tax=Cotesia congregata TaxID=51543 RepID=A0A8J2ED14_COTCN|nr:Protein of unknown function [Cotesia congregata]